MRHGLVVAPHNPKLGNRSDSSSFRNQLRAFQAQLSQTDAAARASWGIFDPWVRWDMGLDWAGLSQHMALRRSIIWGVDPTFTSLHFQELLLSQGLVEGRRPSTYAGGSPQAVAYHHISASHHAWLSQENHQAHT